MGEREARADRLIVAAFDAIPTVPPPFSSPFCERRREKPILEVSWSRSSWLRSAVESTISGTSVHVAHL